MIQFLSHKQPKLVASAINSITEILKTFGVEVVNPKLFAKQFPIIFSHSDKQVRVEGIQLIVELFKWIGPAVNTFLNEGLRPVQLKEIHDQIAIISIDSSSKKPLRQLRKYKINKMIQNIPNKIIDADIPNNQLQIDDFKEIDPLRFVEPVNIMDKISDEFENLLNSSKWKERKDALDSLRDVLRDALKIQSDNLGFTITLVIKKVADANILVAISAANCLEYFAKGLKSNIRPYREEILSALLDRCKEKKLNVIESLRSAMISNVSTFSGFQDCLESSIISNLHHKNPQIREESTRVLIESIKHLSKLITKKEIKILSDLLVPLMDDGISEVREQVANALAFLTKTVGESQIMPFIDGRLDKIKISKIIDRASNDKPKTNCVSNEELLHKKIEGEEKPIPGNEPNPIYNVAPGICDVSIIKLNDVVNSSDEDCLLQIEKIFGSDATIKLKDSQWKFRLEAMDIFFEKIRQILFSDFDLLLKFFIQLSIFKESNFQVLGIVFSCLNETLRNDNKAPSIIMIEKLIPGKIISFLL